MDNQNVSQGRRTFLGAAGTVLAAAAGASAQQKTQSSQKPAGRKLRYALVGTGVRGSSLWGRTLVNNYSDVLEFVGLCDINPKRVEFVKSYMKVNCPTFTDFDAMIAQTKPDLVMVTTMDCFHAKYICRALELGCEVMTEKPLAIDEKQCQEIRDTERRVGKNVRVTFNYRYTPDAVTIRNILASGEIGQITSMDFAWYLDTSHGASYFRRWHAFKQNSGSLLVHKATHHFDIINWWLNADPLEINANGDLRYYGFNGEYRAKSCRECTHKTDCPYFWDITKDAHSMNLYVNCESEDGYIRDSCLYRDNINIWDNMSVQVKYSNDVLLSYSLVAGMPYEGYQVGINGTKGRLDARIYHGQPWKVERLGDLRLTQKFKGTKEMPLGEGGGGHWGADEKMQDMIFRGAPDPMGQSAGTRAGAMSILIGIGARHSIEQNRKITIDEMVKI
ncbi:MAG: Gfo/Idh/MocA family oxidoreductase [Candidatus Latescibacterota bacterium]